jgi:hypothetical protein
MSAVSPELVKSVRKAMPDAPLEKAAEVALMFKDAVSNPIDPNKVDPGLRSLLGIDAGKAAGGGMQDWLSGVNTALAELGKEIAFVPNLPASLPEFQVFDLSGPASQLYPVLSPFRNKVARRSNGKGGGHLAKVITAISGSGTGLGDISPFVSSTSVPLANPNLEAARGNAYSIATADRIFQYQSAAIYGSVTLAEFIASQGFQDTQALVATQNLQVAMQQEDKALLFGRNSLLSAPGQPTGTARNPLSSEVGITGVGVGGTNVYAEITAVGAFGETAGGTTSAAVNIAAAATKVIDFTWTAVSGALAYNVYASAADAGGADPGDGSRYFYGTSGYTSFTVGAAGRVTSGAVVPTSDTGTGDTNAYQGWIQNSVANGAYSKSLNAVLTGSSITQFQDAFFSLYQSTKGNPEEIWVTPQVRQDVSNLIMNGATQPYRLTYDPNQQGGVIAGVFVPTVLNETTGKAVSITVHPWLPKGNAVIAQYTLPFATAFGSNLCAEVVCVQDYMQIKWPMTTLRYESTVFWMSVLSMVAPTFQGWIHGIAHNDDNTAGPLS